MKMKCRIPFLLLLSGTLLSPVMGMATMTDYELCLNEIYFQHDMEVKKAHNKLLSDLGECYHFPVDQGLEECRFEAETHYKKEVEKQRGLLNQKKRGCLKMPWAYLD